MDSPAVIAKEAASKRKRGRMRGAVGHFQGRPAAIDGNSNATLTTRTELATFTQPPNSPNPVVQEIFISAAFHDCLNRPTATAMQGTDGSFTTDLTQIAYAGQGSQPATIFTLTGYNSRGNQTVGIDGKGNSVITIFDGASRAIESQQLQRYNGLGNQGPAGNSTFQSAGLHDDGAESCQYHQISQRLFSTRSA